VHDRVYAFGTRLLLVPMRLLPLRQPLTWLAKVWLRHARIVGHLERTGYDGVIDGGAGVGEFAALVKLALPKADLVCVEPHPASAALLRKHGFTVVEAALWRELGEAILRQPEAAATSCTLLASDSDQMPSWRVGTVRLDGLGVKGHKVLVKLDLQGAEPAALEGMGHLWDRCAGLLLEVSYGEGGTYEPLRAHLAERGFVEAATLNELETSAGVVEADKLFVHRGRLA
jgi:FkbM family methyltransferase